MSRTEFWEKICAGWRWNPRAPREKQYARDWFDQNSFDVLGTAEIVLRAAKKRNSAQGPYVKGNLKDFMAGGWEAFDDGEVVSAPTVEVEPQVERAVEPQQESAWKSLAPAEPEAPDPATLAFDEVWGFWPPNPGRPERRENARRAFLAAHASLGRDDLVMGCRTYADWIEGPQGRAMAFPKHLTTFASDHDGVQQWADRGRAKPDPETLAAFKVCYSDYPEFQGKDRREEEGMAVFRREVKPEDRWEFWCAIMAYRWQRTHHGDREQEDDGLYVVRFTNFIVDWRSYAGPRMGKEVAARLAKAPALKAAIDADEKLKVEYLFDAPNYEKALLARGAGKKHWTEVVGRVAGDLGLDEGAARALSARIVSDQFPSP